MENHTPPQAEITQEILTKVLEFNNMLSEMQQKELYDAYFEILRLASHLDDADTESITKARMRQKIAYAVRRLDKLSNEPLFMVAKNSDRTIIV
jgi:hypothetical protein